eukprot:gene38612-43132_t
MGSVCASNLVEGYASSPSEEYAALVVMGGFVTKHGVADWPVPVLTLGAELDGGSARPGSLTRDIAGSDEAAAAREEGGARAAH